MTQEKPSTGLAENLFFPMILFGAIGGMTWAVRGSSGYGASAGCIFAGVLLGTAWWFLARDPDSGLTRRYRSGWIILAMTVAFGISGNRGWMQWASFFDGIMYTNYGANEFVSISPTYGFVWLFIAGVPWAGLGACAIAWCGEDRISAWQWVVRLACGIGLAFVLSVIIYPRFPEVFLPLYSSLEGKYQDLDTHKNLWKVVRDGREAMIQLGLYLGFLLFEVARRDKRNVTLILVVGLMNGVGWSLLQCWKWSDDIWPGAQFNFWRAWETTGGISIGLAYGVAYYLVNRPTPAVPRESISPSRGWAVAFIVTAACIAAVAPELMPVWCAALLGLVAGAFAIAVHLGGQEDPRGPSLERWGAYVGIILGLGISIQRGFKGWANIYIGNEGYWNDVSINVVGPIMILAMALVSWRVLARPTPAGSDPFPHAYALMWLVMLVQNTLAQFITGPLTNWPEVEYNIYYLILLVLTGVIVHHYQLVRRMRSAMG